LLHPAYFIGILDFPFGSDTDYHTRHLILNKETNEHLLKDIQFSFIELPKFNKQEDQLATPIDKWTFFIKNATVLHMIPTFANEDEGLKTAFLEADRYKWTKEELIAYDNVKIKEADEVQEKLFVAEMAWEEGKVAGKEAQEAETVIKLHNKGKAADEIADLLDMALEKVQQIIKKYVESDK
jgi:predicted transposase/invertase (TIGR01784 family)